MTLGDKARELLAAFPPAYWQALAVVMALYLVSPWRRCISHSAALASLFCWQGACAAPGRRVQGASSGNPGGACSGAARGPAHRPAHPALNTRAARAPATQARFDVAFITLHASTVRCCSSPARCWRLALPAAPQGAPTCVASARAASCLCFCS